MHRMRRYLAFLRNDNGAAAVEFAIVCLPLTVWLCGIMDFARIQWLQRGVQNEVHKSMRVMTMNPAVTVDMAVQDLQSKLTMIDPTQLKVTAEVRTTATSDRMLKVTVAYNIAPVFVYFATGIIGTTLVSEFPMRKA